jgi:hypothetical protein
LHPDFAPFRELDHLNAMVALPKYRFATTGPAMRIGAACHEPDEARPRLRLLDIRSDDDAAAKFTPCAPLSRFPE